MDSLRQSSLLWFSHVARLSLLRANSFSPSKDACSAVEHEDFLLREESEIYPASQTFTFAEIFRNLTSSSIGALVNAKFLSSILMDKAFSARHGRDRAALIICLQSTKLPYRLICWIGILIA